MRNPTSEGYRGIHLVSSSSANRLLTVNGAAVTHELNGCLTAYSGATYAWDTRGRLRTLVKGGATYTFGYGPVSLRTSKALNGATTSFLLDGESIVSEIATSGTTHLLQSPVVDQPLKRGDRWFVPEKLGSAALLTDGSGNTVQSYGYKPFGELTNSPTESNPFQFTGRENDGTGLMYYRARYYAPQWGGSSPGRGVLGDAHKMRRSHFAIPLLLLLLLLLGLSDVEHEHEQE